MRLYETMRLVLIQSWWCCMQSFSYM